VRDLKKPFMVRDLVLLGGGHSHIQVLKSFGMKQLPGVRLTVISKDYLTPYSGMLPGHISRYFNHDSVHIDLHTLAKFAGARLIHSEAVGLDLTNGRVCLADHPDLRFDLLSINIGGVSSFAGSKGIPVKPIGGFLEHLNSLKDKDVVNGGIVVVGGGLGGIELVLSLRARFGADTSITLVNDKDTWDFRENFKKKLKIEYERANIKLVMGFRAVGFDGTELYDVSGRTLKAKYVFWTTGVAGPSWIKESGLAVSDDGFLLVDRDLRSVSHPHVFGSGDIADVLEQERPKSGVFAVRQGKILDENLRRSLTGRPLKKFRAQRRFLQLIGTGDGRAIALRGGWVASGRWVWHWKTWIDRKFIRAFSAIPGPAMEVKYADVPSVFAEEMPEQIRCGGCGSKIGSYPLEQALERLPAQPKSSVIKGIGDDAAVIKTPDEQTVLTIDGFRGFLSDPYRFGRITAHHALNDVLAMGAHGVSALAFAAIPLMSDIMMEDDLYQLLKGVVDILNLHGVSLVGGHSSESQELFLSLTITGKLTEHAWYKDRLAPGQSLILTKAIGTGVLLAGDMRGVVGSRAFQRAISSMDKSNAGTVAIFREFGASAATDVSGFGLTGHLLEMLRASDVGVRLHINSVPLLPTVEQLMSEGIMSSLQSQNERSLSDFQVEGLKKKDPRILLLADPQTSGGLLVSVPTPSAQKCIEALHRDGFYSASIIGETTSAEDGMRIFL